MVKKRDPEEDSEWEGQEEESDDDVSVEEEHESSEEEEEESETPPKKKPKTATPPKVKKESTPSSRKKTVNYDSDDEEDEFLDLPTSVRKTAHGGYAHTKDSRLKISKANRGNTPWNKGKNRSDDAKAKISAGVKARNLELLRKKCAVFGITEEEYAETKKKQKYHRELLRRAKLSDKKNNGKLKTKPPVESYVPESLRAIVPPVPPDFSFFAEKQKEVEEVVEEEEEEEEEDEDEEQQEEEDAKEIESSEMPPELGLMQRDFHWTPHPFDTLQDDGSGRPLYAQVCPKGGPGGLICCSACTATFSSFLTSTFQDIQEQMISKVAEELDQAIRLGEEAQQKLEETVEEARLVSPPGQKVEL